METIIPIFAVDRVPEGNRALLQCCHLVGGFIFFNPRNGMIILTDDHIFRVETADQSWLAIIFPRF